MNKQIVIVSNGDDWEGLYIDGKLVTENHRLSPRDVLNALGLTLERKHVSTEYLGGEVVSLPQNIKEIPKRAFTN